MIVHYTVDKKKHIRSNLTNAFNSFWFIFIPGVFLLVVGIVNLALRLLNVGVAFTFIGAACVALPILFTLHFYRLTKASWNKYGDAEQIEMTLTADDEKLLIDNGDGTTRVIKIADITYWEMRKDFLVIVQGKGQTFLIGKEAYVSPLKEILDNANYTKAADKKRRNFAAVKTIVCCISFSYVCFAIINVVSNLYVYHADNLMFLWIFYFATAVSIAFAVWGVVRKYKAVIVIALIVALCTAFSGSSAFIFKDSYGISDYTQVEYVREQTGLYIPENIRIVNDYGHIAQVNVKAIGNDEAAQLRSSVNSDSRYMTLSELKATCGNAYKMFDTAGFDKFIVYNTQNGAFNEYLDDFLDSGFIYIAYNDFHSTLEIRIVP